MRADAWLEHLATCGRATFTSAEASVLGPTPVAARMALSRLLKAGRIVSPHRGFYVVVAPEYRRLGCPPAPDFLDQLMKWLGVPYYIALLSAAAKYGAAHQAPQRMQVIVPKPRKRIRCGAIAVDFIVRSDFENTVVVQRVGTYGYLAIASAEATALEVVGYERRCAGIDHVATVLTELAEVLDPGKLTAAAALYPVAWVQRLGWLLDRVGQPTLAQWLIPVIERRANAPVPLLPRAPSTGARLDPRWRLRVNVEVDPDDV